METRTLGSGPLAAAVIGLGCNNFGMKLERDASIRSVPSRRRLVSHPSRMRWASAPGT